MSFTHQGKKYTWFEDTFVEANTAYIVRTGGGNFARYNPPKIKGSTPMPNSPDGIPVEFVVPALTGGQSTRVPIYAADGAVTQVTEGTQQPAWVRMQILPEQFSGIKLTNITEDRMYSDAG
jgi:hypothetical protein